MRREKFRVLITPFAVAVRVTGNVPVAALPVAWKVTEAKAEPDAGAEMVAGEKAAVSPLGSPVAVRAMDDAKPLTGPAIARATAGLAVFCAMVSVLEASVKLKVNGVTVRVITA